APVARVREQVERNDKVFGMTCRPVADEVRADEAGRAGDEQPHAGPSSSQIDASRGERIGASVLQRCLTRGSAPQIPRSSGCAASFSSVTRYANRASVSAS